MLMKLGVDISRLSKEIRRTLPTVETAYADYNNFEAIITSTYEGTHGVNSLHYGNKAIDFRMPETMVAAEQIVTRLKHKLGDKYDVLLSNNCIHVEWDPK